MSSLELDELKKINPLIQLTVFGYSRRSQKLLSAIDNPYYIIPELVVYTILYFYYQPPAFNVCSINDKDVLLNDGKIFSIKSLPMGYINAGDSNGKKTGTFTIKIREMDVWVVIGITSNIDNCKKDKRMHEHVDGKTYFVYGNDTGHGGARQSGNKKPNFRHPGFKHGDAIKIEWNERGEFKAYTNDAEIGTMEIEKGLIYYPCVCRKRRGDVELEISE